MGGPSKPSAPPPPPPPQISKAPSFFEEAPAKTEDVGTDERRRKLNRKRALLSLDDSEGSSILGE